MEVEVPESARAGDVDGLCSGAFLNEFIYLVECFHVNGGGR